MQKATVLRGFLHCCGNFGGKDGPICRVVPSLSRFDRNPFNQLRILFQRSIHCQQISRDGLRLRDQQAVERVAVMPGHMRNRIAVA